MSLADLKPSVPTMSQADLKPTVGLETLLKLIPDFDTAQPAQVYRFIRSCDSAFEIASLQQRSILITFALNKIIGPGASDIHSKQFSLWTELKTYLIQKFSQTKTLAHLYLELQSMFQKSNESITNYFLRVDLSRSKILEKIATEVKDSTFEGRKATAEETALNVFINGIHSDIGTMLRVHSFNQLSDAGNFAIQEEKIRNMNAARQRLYRNDVAPPTTSQIRRQMPVGNQTQRPYQNAPQISNNTKTSSKFCNYCKNPGHEISECRKREYNNRMKNNQKTQYQYQPRLNPPTPARVNNLNSQATEDLSMSTEIASIHCSTVPKQISNSADQYLETDQDNSQLQW